MTSGASCGFTCPANQVVDKTTTCKDTVITLGSCKASYCDGVDTYAKASDAGAKDKGDCGTTLALGGTCTPGSKSGYTCTGKVTCSSTSAANTKGTKTENFACTAKPTACAISSGAAVTPAGATATGACTTLINAKTMTSGASCGFTCPANQVVDKTTTCKDTVITLGSCKASYCDGVDTYAKASDAGAKDKGDCGTTLALGGTCTPGSKSGYTCTGKVTCSSTSAANTKGTKTENFACTASACTGLSAPANGAVGDCTSTLNSGSTCTPTCNAGYTKVGTTRSCLAGTVTDVKCEQDCATALAKPTTPAGITFTGGTCTVGGKLKGGATCSWGTPNAGNTCSAVKCTAGSLTGGTCAKTTCDFSAVPTNGAVGDCTKTVGGGSSAVSCTPTCNSGYTASGARTCGVNGVTPAVGAAGNNFVCTANPPDTCTVTQTNGAKGTCNAAVGGTTTASGTTCTTACNAGYMTQTLKTTCSSGVATCNCDSSCAPGSCYTSAASQCTACKSDDYKLTANKDSKTFTTGTCTWKYTYTSPVSMTQKVSFSITAAQFKGKEASFAKGYGISLSLATVAGWKSGCKGSAAVVSRRSSIDINFATTSTAALAAAAAKAATELTNAALIAALKTGGVANALADALKSIGKVHINGASRTGVAALTAVAAMVAGLLWQ